MGSWLKIYFEVEAREARLLVNNQPTNEEIEIKGGQMPITLALVDY